MKPTKSSTVATGPKDLLLSPLTLISVAFFLLYLETISRLSKGFLRQGGSYGLVIVGISLWMIWVKRDQLRQLTASPQVLPGTAITVLGCLMLVTGKLSSTMMLQYLAMIVTLCGLVLLVWGRHYFKALLIPLLYLILMFPLMEELLVNFSTYLQSIAAVIGFSLLKLGGMPAFRSGHVIELPHITLRVARACNGVNHIIALVALGIPLAVWTQRTWPRRGLFILFAVFVALFANGLRVALIGVWTAYYPGSSFHGPFDIFYTFFILFVGMALLFLAAGLTRLRRPIETNRKNVKPSAAGSTPHKSGQTHSNLSRNGPASNPNSSRPTHPARGVASVATALFILVATTGFLHFYKPRPVELVTPLSSFPLKIKDWNGHDVDLTDKKLLRVPADSELYRLYRDNSGNEIRLYIGYFAQQEQNREIVHYHLDWLHYDAEVIQVPLGSPATEIKKTISSSKGKLETIYFWYDVNGRILVDRYKTKLVTLIDAFTGRRTNGALILISSANDGHTRENTALQFVQSVLPVASSFLNNHPK
jgi:EpsI family protein